MTLWPVVWLNNILYCQVSQQVYMNMDIHDLRMNSNVLMAWPFFQYYHRSGICSRVPKECQNLRTHCPEIEITCLCSWGDKCQHCTSAYHEICCAEHFSLLNQLARLPQPNLLRNLEHKPFIFSFIPNEAGRTGKNVLSAPYFVWLYFHLKRSPCSYLEIFTNIMILQLYDHMTIFLNLYTNLHCTC